MKHPCRVASPLPLVTLAGLVSATGAQTVNDEWSFPVPLVDAGATGEYLASVHGTLLPDGRVLLMGFAQDELAPPTICGEPMVTVGRVGTRTAIFDPDAMLVGSNYELTTYAEAVEDSSTSYCPGENACGAMDCTHDTYFCSGHAPLADGRVFVAGGLGVHNMSAPLYTGGGGLDYGAIFDPDPGVLSWSMVEDTLGNLMRFTGGPGRPYTFQTYFNGTERYYPTVTRYIDGRMLILSGSQILGASDLPRLPGSGPIQNLTAEFYDPDVAAVNAPYSQVAMDPPAQVFNSDYSHAFVLPKQFQTYDMILIGYDGTPVFFDVDGETWHVEDKVRPGPPIPTPNKGASSLLLPLRVNNGQFDYANGSILVTGGQPNPEGTPPGAGHYADVYDLTSGLGEWNPDTERIELIQDRHHPATVILPNADIAVIGGHVPGDPFGFIELNAEYIHLRDGLPYSVEEGNPLDDREDEIWRGYHTVALLLPDGRVMVTGGRAGGANSSPIERASVQFLSPPYMFQERPVINTAPSTMTAGSGQVYTVTSSSPINEVVLVGFGSMTHSVDMNQRHLQLRKVEAVPIEGPMPMLSYVAAVKAPSKRWAPPGYYMLFVLTGPNRVPSEAKIVQVL
ncbi:MAG: galactose oxidase early set domain-containing protein [Planctomycetota bacterium]